MHRHFDRSTVSRKLGGLALALLLAFIPEAQADVQPGDRITTANAAKAKDLLSPGMNWCVERGFPMDVIATRDIPLRRAYREATEKFSSQARLSADGLQLENFVAGRPFPNVTESDPQAAMKIMQNYGFAIPFDDLEVRNFDSDTGAVSTERPLQVERHFLLSHFRRLFYVGRLYVDPKPKLPNPEGYHFKETMHPMIEPFDLKGVGFTYYRYLDPERSDDSWLYLPALRRVRRLSTAQRSDALFGQDTDQDSYGGYSGAMAWMDWKLLGSKTVLSAHDVPHFPVHWADGAADWAFVANWEKRDVWVIEGVSKLPQYAFSKRVLYVDKHLYTIPYSDMYDRSGQLWKIWVNGFHWAKAPFPGSPLVYDEVTGFIPGAVMVDMQLNHATKVSLPSHRFPGEPGWYFHQGEDGTTTEDQFTIAELISSGH